MYLSYVYKVPSVESYYLIKVSYEKILSHPSNSRTTICTSFSQQGIFNTQQILTGIWWVTQAHENLVDFI